MKYDDDELAEAALLLGHVSDDDTMPAALEAKILAQGEAIVSEKRYTTTKAAVLEVEGPAELPAPRRAPRWATAAWLAAAACVAFLVYEWRLSSIEHARTVSTAAAAAAPIALTSPAGAPVADVAWDAAARAGSLTVRDLPASAPGERYRLWLSESDAAHAVAVGELACEGGCAGRVATFEAPSVTRARRAWLTRASAGDAAFGVDPAKVVAEGADASR